MRIICYANPNLQRAVHIATAMRDGLLRHGIKASIEAAFHKVNADLAIAYGWSNAAIFSAYREAGKHFLYADLGYWLRKPPGKRLDGYHKVVLDSWCPTATMVRSRPADRFNALNIPVLPPRRSGKKIIIAGMSAKSAADHDLGSEQWERAAIGTIATQTKREIVYRPKPSWELARPLPGAAFDKGADIATALSDAHALITHHSNAAVDAIAAGVPVYCAKGVGSLLSTVDLADIESRRHPDDRERLQLLHDIAYLQWSVAEIRDGTFWDHHKDAIR